MRELLTLRSSMWRDEFSRVRAHPLPPFPSCATVYANYTTPFLLLCTAHCKIDAGFPGYSDKKNMGRCPSWSRQEIWGVCNGAIGAA